MKLKIPETPANLRTISAAIKAIAGGDVTLATAHDNLLDLAKTAQDEGVVLDKFWFEDRKWLKREKGGAYDSRESRSNAAIDRAFKRANEKA